MPAGLIVYDASGNPYFDTSQGNQLTRFAFHAVSTSGVAGSGSGTWTAANCAAFAVPQNGGYGLLPPTVTLTDNNISWTSASTVNCDIYVIQYK